MNAAKTPGEWENSLKFPALYFLELWERGGESSTLVLLKIEIKDIFISFKKI